MTEPRIDAERLAALLDGRLDDRQREELLALLASDEPGFDVFAEALAVTRELEEGEGGATVVPMRARPAPWWDRPGLRALAVAAGLGALVAIPWAVQRGGAPDAQDPVLSIMARSGGTGLPDGWDGTPWSERRSRGQPVTPESRSVRAGARLVDLELAVRGGDDAATRAAAADLAALLDGVPAAGPAAAIYETIGDRADEPAAELESLLDSGRVSIVTLLDERLVELGAWVEAARLAAARQDAAFFQADESRRVLEAAAASTEIPTVSRGAAERILASISAEGAPSWPDLERELTPLLQSLATG